MKGRFREMKLTVMHDWLVRLVLEVAVPSRPKLLARPRVHHLQLLFCRPDLHTSFDTVGCQWPSAIDVPLVEDLLLYLRVATNEVVERLDMRLSAEYRESLRYVSHTSFNYERVRTR